MAEKMEMLRSLVAGDEPNAVRRALEELIETVPYPEPPEYVRDAQSYYDGCMAYRAELLRAIRD